MISLTDQNQKFDVLRRGLVWMLFACAVAIATTFHNHPLEVPRFMDSMQNAIKWLNEGEFDRARVAYRIALTVDGGNRVARWGMEKSNVLRLLPEMDLSVAERWLKRAEQGHPRDPYVTLFSAELAVRVGDKEVAIGRYQYALKLEPDLHYAKKRLDEIAYE